MCFKRLVECSCRVRSDNMHSYVGGRVVCTPIVFVALHCQLEVCCWSRQHVVVVRVNIFVVISSDVLAAYTFLQVYAFLVFLATSKLRCAGIYVYMYHPAL